MFHLITNFNIFAERRLNVRVIFYTILPPVVYHITNQYLSLYSLRERINLMIISLLQQC